ncbi:hypothetical protein LR48_Vigan05g038700 [Vigna angularis]|uniref:Uncharacterized protein n=1 Tax=Phaseolus angularis TaxID=3914 RepID=A0A0L9UJ34_PHAAN|nr:hypothetical protein LR48_Vigan05g038700 [Vigna angularis]
MQRGFLRRENMEKNTSKTFTLFIETPRLRVFLPTTQSRTLSTVSTKTDRHRLHPNRHQHAHRQDHRRSSPELFPFSSLPCEVLSVPRLPRPKESNHRESRLMPPSSGHYSPSSLSPATESGSPYSLLLARERDSLLLHESLLGRAQLPRRPGSPLSVKISPPSTRCLPLPNLLPALPRVDSAS